MSGARPDLEEIHHDDELDAILEELRKIILQTPADKRRIVAREVLQDIAPDPASRAALEPLLLTMIEEIEEG